MLDALSRAPHLTEAESGHLRDLARAVGPAHRARRRPPARQERIRPNLARILDGVTEVAAFVENGRLDVLAANRLAQDGGEIHAWRRSDTFRSFDGLELREYVYAGPAESITVGK